MAQPGTRPYFNPGLAVLPLSLLRDNAANTTLTALVDVTRWLKGVTYTQEANIGDATAVGDRSMGKSTGKPDNGNVDVEIMRSYSNDGPMKTIQKYVSYPAICMWTDDTSTDAKLNTVIAGDRVTTRDFGSNATAVLRTNWLGDNDHNHDQYRFAIVYITGVVHTDGNVQNADASSMSMSWPIDGDVFSAGSSIAITANASTGAVTIGGISDGAISTTSNNWEILGG